MSEIRLQDDSDEAKAQLLDAILPQTVDAHDSCLQWTGKANQTGYGVMRWEGSEWLVHRAMYTALTDDPIPEGMVILHLCDNRLCCNPRHLCAGTRDENMQDMWEKGRDRTTVERELFPKRLWSRFEGLDNARVRALPAREEIYDRPRGWSPDRVLSVRWPDVSEAAKAHARENVRRAVARARARKRGEALPEPEDVAGGAQAAQPADAAPQPDGVSHFFTKVVGVTFPNADGSSRQEILARCRIHERLLLEHEPDNPYDPHAVRVLRRDNAQLGYLRKELATDVAARLALGWSYTAYVMDLTGGTVQRTSRGANIMVITAEPHAAGCDTAAYFAAHGRDREGEGEDV